MRRSVVCLVLLGACGGAGGHVAATVNGVDIDVTEVTAMRVETNATTINKALFATDLTDAIIDAAIVGAVSDEFGIEPSDGEIATKVADLTEQIESSQGVSVDEFFTTQGLPVARLQVIARQQVIRDKLREEFAPNADPVTDEDAALLLGADRLGRTTACVSHILVPTEEDANAALGRIKAGETFAEVATDVGTDGSAPIGGELGCNPLSRYVPDFAQAAYEAPIGEVSDPVQTDFGYHLILVESRQEQSLEELKDEITDARVGELVAAWILERVNAAEVEVDPQYGTWVLEPTPMVQAPST